MARQVSMNTLSETELWKAYEALDLSPADSLDLRDKLLNEAGKLFHPIIRQDTPLTALGIIHELILNLKNSGHLADIKESIRDGNAPSISVVVKEDYFYLRNDTLLNFLIRFNGSKNPRQKEFVDTPINKITPRQLLKGMDFIPRFGKKTAAQLLAISLIYETFERLSPKIPARIMGEKPKIRESLRPLPGTS